MLLTQGGRSWGYGLYVQKERLIYHDNFVGVAGYTIMSKEPIPVGDVTLKAVYKSDTDKPFAGATLTFYANEKQIGEGRVEKSIPNRVTLDETLDIGFDTGTPLTEGYDIPFKFTGRFAVVTIELN